MPSFRDLALFLFFLGIIFEMSDDDTQFRAITELRDVWWIRKEKEKRTRAVGDSEFKSQCFIDYSYLIVFL